MALELWDVSKGKFEPIHKWSGIHNKEIGGVAWVPGSPIVAAADKDGRVVLYNTETREKVCDKQLSGTFENIQVLPPADKAAAGKNLRLVVANWSGKGQIYLLNLTREK
jgi:WD40 repeat protein